MSLVSELQKLVTKPEYKLAIAVLSPTCPHCVDYKHMLATHTPPFPILQIEFGVLKNNIVKMKEFIKNAQISKVEAKVLRAAVANCSRLAGEVLRV